MLNEHANQISRLPFPVLRPFLRSTLHRPAMSFYASRFFAAFLLLLSFFNVVPAFPSPLSTHASRVAPKTKWRIATVSSGAPQVRHEACAVRVRGLIVLLGGRGVNKPVSIYNPVNRTWVNKDGPGPAVEIHHTQCVVFNKQVWIVSSWTGGFPFERNNDKIYIYDVKKDKWFTRPGLPEYRRRGGAAAILRKKRIHVIGGNRGGHGGHAKSLTWHDAYDLKQEKWILNLKSLPDGEERDHVGGAVVKGQLCIAGGRDGGDASFFTKNKAATYCFSIRKNKWRKADDMPAPRAGAMTARTCNGNMMVAGGEGAGKAYRRVDVFNGTTWESAPKMTRARHGSGLAICSCSCGHIFVPSGSGSQGGSPELPTTEQYIPAGAPKVCSRY